MLLLQNGTNKALRDVREEKTAWSISSHLIFGWGVGGGGQGDDLWTVAQGVGARPTKCGSSGGWSVPRGCLQKLAGRRSGSMPAGP